MSYADIALAQKARKFTHHITVCDNRPQNQFGHLEVEFGCIGIESHRRIVAVVKDDLAAGSGKTDGLAQQSSGIGNVADNGVSQHQIVLPVMGIAALAVRLVIFDIL